MKNKALIKQYMQIITKQREACKQRMYEVGNLSPLSDTVHNAYDQCIAVGRQHGLSDDDIDRYYYKALDVLDKEAGIYPDDNPKLVGEMTINKERIALGMTHKQFAKFMGIPRKTMDALIHDERKHRKLVGDILDHILIGNAKHNND